MSSPAAFSGYLKFGSLMVMGIMGFGGLKIYNKVKTQEIFHVLRHGKAFHDGLYLMAVAGICLFAWSLVSLLPNLFFRKWLLFFMGLVDLVLTGGVIAALVLQGRYLPHNRSSCKNAVSWRNTTDGQNFFILTANLSSSSTSPADVCNSYVGYWLLAASSIGMCIIWTVVNLGVGFAEICSNYSAPRAPSYRTRTRPRWNCSIFNISMPSIFRFQARYWSKSGQKFATNKSVKFSALPRMHSNPVKQSSLATILGPRQYFERFGTEPRYDSLELIARDLHYADFVNFSLASKSFRTAIFPEESFESRCEILRIHTCDDNSKVQCSICPSQICASCTQTRSLIPSIPSRHLTTCESYCTPCYRKEIIRPGLTHHKKWCRTPIHDKSIRSHNLPTKKKFMVTTKSVQDYLHNKNAFGVDHRVCRVCADTPENKLQQRLEAKDLAEMRRLAQLPLTCSACRAPIQEGGPRWWVCSACNGECRDSCHPAWDVETGV